MAKKKESPKSDRAKAGKTVKKTTKTPVKSAKKTKAAPKKAAVKAKKTVVKAKAKAVKAPASPSLKLQQSKAKSTKISLDPLAQAAVDGILEVKGRNISVLNLKHIHNRVCDYFIICQADSNTQVNAIANSVAEIVKKRTGERPYRSEGFENSEWILVDYVTLVVHIFQTQVRNFYNLESLWADAEVTEIAFD